MIKLKSEVKQMWIDDLIANADLKGKGWLQSQAKTGPHKEFCCLGRLCELSHKANWRYGRGSIDYLGETLMLPIEVINWAFELNSDDNRFELRNGEFDVYLNGYEVHVTLMYINDFDPVNNYHSESYLDALALINAAIGKQVTPLTKYTFPEIAKIIEVYF